MRELCDGFGRLQARGIGPKVCLDADEYAISECLGFEQSGDLLGRRNLFEPDEKVEVECPSALQLNSAKICRNPAKYTHRAFTCVEVTSTLQDRRDHEMKELRSCLRIFCDVLRSLCFVRAKGRHEIIHVDVLPSKDLGNPILKVRGIDGNPE